MVYIAQSSVVPDVPTLPQGKLTEDRYPLLRDRCCLLMEWYLRRRRRFFTQTKTKRELKACQSRLRRSGCTNFTPGKLTEDRYPLLRDRCCLLMEWYLRRRRSFFTQTKTKRELKACQSRLRRSGCANFTPGKTYRRQVSATS